MGKHFLQEATLTEVQSIIEKIRADFQEEKSEEEVIQSLTPIMEEGSEMAEQVVEALGNISHPQICHVLQRLSEFSTDKKIRKAIKRSLYRLKSKGIAVEEVISGKEMPVFRPLQAEPPSGFGGPFDFLGQRFLMLVVPHIGRGLKVMQGIISDTVGLVDFSGGEMPRNRFKEFFKEIQHKSPFPLIEMEPSYVGFLFVRASQLTLHQGKTPSQEYLQMKKETEGIKKEYEKPLIYSYIRAEDIEENERFLNQGGDLLKTDLFADWVTGEEEIRPYADEVWEAQESRLILNRAQKEARFQEIYQRAISNLFPEEKRSLYRERMEEMAYYLFKTGKAEEAKVSLAVALDLKKAPNQIQPNPFLLQLVIKSIFSLLSETHERKKEEFSLIAKP